MSALFRVWPWVRPYRSLLFVSLLGTFVSVGINLLIPLQTSRVIDDGIAPGDTGVVRQTVLVMIALILTGIVTFALTMVIAVRMAFNTTTDLRRDLYAHSMSLSFGNLDRLSSGEILTRLTSDLTKVTTVLTIGISFVAQTPIMFIGSLVAIIRIDASLVPIVLTMVPVIGTLVWFVLSRSGGLYDAVQTRLDHLNTVLQENIQGTEVIKSFVRQEQQTKKFDQVADDLAFQATVVNQLVASLIPTLIMISSLGVAGVIWLGGVNVIAGTLSEGELVAFISYMAMVAAPMIMFAFIQPMLSAAGASMARINQVLQEVPEVRDAHDGFDLSTLASPGEIRFDNVRFRYNSSDTSEQLDDALCNISLHIPQGQTLAILGATGSGKSSLVHLIPRFYDASEGTVSLGGVDVKELTKRSLRQVVGIALQEPQLFSGTVLENLRYGRPEASENEARAAAVTAQADEFIRAMPSGYQSVIEQNGANLSGGQRQRLAIARTLLANPQVLILDDSTSAVDLETEAKIQQALSSNTDQTVVIVAQRISTALGADEILVLDDGQICAQGSHEQLIETSEIYGEIFRSQLGEAVQ